MILKMLTTSNLMIHHLEDSSINENVPLSEMHMAAIELESTLVKYAASFICAVNLVTQLFLLPAHLVPFSRCDGSARFATLVMHSPSASYSPLPEYSSAMLCVECIESHINTNAAAVLCALTVIFCVDGNMRPRKMLQARLHSIVVQIFSQQRSAR
jgi:hypothetical protein